MNLEQELAELKAIVDGAPEGATHSSNYYLKRTDDNPWRKFLYYWYDRDNGLWFLMGDHQGLRGKVRALSDINRQIELIEQLLKVQEDELKNDLRAMINARRLIKANKRTSNGRLCMELFGRMGLGSARDYCRKLGLDPDSNETPYHTEIQEQQQ